MTARGRLALHRPLVGVLLTRLLACSPAAVPSPPASDASPPAIAAPAAASPTSTTAAPTPTPPADVRPPEPPTSATPADAPPTAANRECRNGERLDSGCTCSDGACFDICCGPQAGCAHPAEPGGASACILLMNPPPPKPAKPCTDGQFLGDGCICNGRICMDICCVGSVCSHHRSASEGWAKCRKQ